MTRERAIIVFLLVVVLALGWALLEKSKRDNFDLRAKCGEQAAREFARLGYRESGPTNGIFAGYESRYNPSLNRCFMTLHTTSYSENPVTQVTGKSLFDAFEQREYAEFTGTRTSDQQDHVMICILSLPTETKRYCKSEAEYDAFVASYMK